MIKPSNWISRFRTLFSSNFKPINKLKSKALEREIRVDLYLPSGFRPFQQKVHCFIFNDGQDLVRMQLEDRLAHLRDNDQYPPFAVVGLHANANRMREYGTAAQADYAGRGDLAGQYEIFVRKELMPWLRRKCGLAFLPEDCSIAGFSLGGLSALDLLWRNPDLFAQVGVFSGSLWWRSSDFDPKNPDADRIAHYQIANGQHQDQLKFWLQTGTEDEKSDRNKNGVIDAIDDTLDLIKELEKLGYEQPKDIHYLEVVGGRHEPATWAKVLPDFIEWVLHNKQAQN